MKMKRMVGTEASFFYSVDSNTNSEIVLFVFGRGERLLVGNKLVMQRKLEQLFI